ncbi:DNA binding domain-containing protein, excisionase family [Acetoanaerobium noterae]|uniref:DNA binding domain-containing protein, excisionase family n=1 Tax=Acetoanaerobium noterae TaxID=745369 RepID=A0A1T5ALT9_9FIRM|nr:helix-turn-helix domain-containing protein [Acetoanaerobium noterae]SKB35553.1 DNA binding domain-containing protein, excisionase family [Acetoanaerobium noterae]
MNLMSVKDLSANYNIKKSTAYEMVKIKGFPAVRVNSKYFIIQEDFEKWIRSNIGKTVM